MGSIKETGILCLVPYGEITVGYCFACCFFFGTSPPGYEPGDEESEEAADRRRGLLKKVCSQGSAVSQRINEPWSDSTSVRKPILLNWMPLSFLPSTSACYWDPEAKSRKIDSYPQCSLQEEYNAFSWWKNGLSPSCLEFYHNSPSRSPPTNPQK